MKNKQNYQQYCFYHNGFITGETCGYVVASVRSIGHRWVWLRIGSAGNFRRITRKAWNDITRQKDFSTLEERQHRIDVCNQARKLGLKFWKGKHPRLKTKSLDESKSEIYALTKKEVA